jgi:1A family penicillin-binding protein
MTSNDDSSNDNSSSKGNSLSLEKLKLKHFSLKTKKNKVYWIIGALTLITLFFTISFIYSIDQMVARRLQYRKYGDFSAVFSSPIVIKPGVKIPLTLLEERLIARGYRKNLSGKLTESGQYSCVNGECIIFQRGYEIPRVSTEVAGAKRYRLSDGRILNYNSFQPDKIALEPIILAPLGTGNIRASTFKSKSEISPYMINAVLAVEDRRFYNHRGVDPVGIFRAIVRNISAMKLVEGGSTLTQQLAKNLLFSPQKTLTRKLRELVAAFSLEFRLTKEEILTLYLNEVYFSQEGSVAVHGVQEAAKTFFGKNATDLTLDESALLAGMIRAPSVYSPRRNIAKATNRRNQVLSLMEEMGFITNNEKNLAVKKPVTIVKISLHERKAPFFMARLENELVDNYGIDSLPQAGLRVYSTIDEKLQSCAEKAVSNGINNIVKNYGLNQSTKSSLQHALVAIDPRDGAIKAWVGGHNFSLNQFDHVNQAKRQIGSTIKPFLYLTALDPELNSYKVATPLSILGDEPTGITLIKQGTWKPQNYDKKYRGDVTLRYSLEKSLNLPAVYVAQRVGIPAVVRTLSKFRVAENISAVPALALGALDTSLLELTASFGGLAQLAVYTPPRMFHAVINQENEVLVSLPPTPERVTSPDPAYLLTDILRGVIERGTGNSARSSGFNYPAAGKTGTSNDGRDSWFMGYTPELVAGVWTGYDDNRATRFTGGTVSAPTWGDFMACASATLSGTNFQPPPGVVMVEVDRRNRKRPFSFCRPPQQYLMKEIFLRGTEPPQGCVRGITSSRVSNGSRNIRGRGYPYSNQVNQNRSFWQKIFN